VNTFIHFRRTPETGYRLIERPVRTKDSTTEKHGHNSVPQAGFESTILVFERRKTIRSLYRAATEAGSSVLKRKFM